MPYGGQQQKIETHQQDAGAAMHWSSVQQDLSRAMPWALSERIQVLRVSPTLSSPSAISLPSAGTETSASLFKAGTKASQGASIPSMLHLLRTSTQPSVRGQAMAQSPWIFTAAAQSRACGRRQHNAVLRQYIRMCCMLHCFSALSSGGFFLRGELCCYALLQWASRTVCTVPAYRCSGIPCKASNMTVLVPAGRQPSLAMSELIT